MIGLGSKQGKVLAALIEKGLDVKTGKSPVITIASLERSTGMRLVSNGSAVIREDAEVFNKFQIHKIYDKDSGTTVSVEFLGYHTIGSYKDYIKVQEHKADEKINAMYIKKKNLLETRLELEKHILLGRQDTDKLFSVNDL